MGKCRKHWADFDGSQFAVFTTTGLMGEITGEPFRDGIHTGVVVTMVRTDGYPVGDVESLRPIGPVAKALLRGRR